MAKRSIALLVGAGIWVPASAAQAQVPPPPLLPGVEVSPSTLSAPGDVTVRVPGFEGEQGCRFGAILAGTSLADARVLLSGNFDVPGTFSASSFEGDAPFATGIYSIFVRCTDEGSNLTEYSTDQSLTILPTATTIPTTTTTTGPPVQTGVTQAQTTTTTAPPGTQGTVDPPTAKPGETTITIRGGGFKPDAPLQISLGTTPPFALGTTTATGSGAYAATLKLPVSTPPGTHQLVVTGPGPDDVSRSTTATLTVQDLDCKDFVPPATAQAALAGGRDPHGLDADKDGIACEADSTRPAAGSGGGGVTQTGAAPGGSLPQTGTERSTIGVMAGLTAMTLGALLVGLSHPAVAASGRHRRRRTGRQ